LVQNGNAFIARAFAFAGGVAMVVRRLVSLLLVLALLVGSSRAEAWSSPFSSAGDVFRLTSSGQAKAAAAAATVATGIGWARLIMGASVALSALQLGIWVYNSGLWDWINYSSPGTVGLPVYNANDPLAGQAVFASSGQVEWIYTITYNYQCSGASQLVANVPSGWNVGGWIRTDTVGACPNKKTISWWSLVPVSGTPEAALLPSPPATSVGDQAGHSDLAAAKATLATARPVAVATWGSNSTPVQAIDAANDIISGGIALTPGTDYTSGAGQSPAGTPGATDTVAAPAVDYSSITSAVSAGAVAVAAAIAASQAAVVSAVDAVAAAIAASQAAVVAAVAAVAAPIVAAISGEQAAVVSAVDGVKAAVQAIPAGGGAGVTTAVDNLAAADVARDQAATAAADAVVTPAFVCTVCTRVATWSTLFTSLQATAASAPIFGLISRLAWPGSGSIARTWTLGSWQGRAMTVNLDGSGIGTAIMVTRFVVVGGAVILAYMIIFG